MILKILLVGLVIGIVYFMFIKKKPIQEKKKHEEKKKKADRLESNDMVACAECGTYTELNDSIISSSKYYCSNECVDKS